MPLTLWPSPSRVPLNWLASLPIGVQLFSPSVLSFQFSQSEMSFSRMSAVSLPLMLVCPLFTISAKRRSSSATIVFTMMFGGGLIPTYIVLRSLGFVNSPLAVIIPTCTNAYFMILMMNAYLGVPQSTVEAAQLDGAGHFRLMFQICLPQCMSIATVVLLYSVVFQWNSWFQAYVYLSSAKEWWPLQLVVNNMISENTTFTQSANIDYSRYLIQYGLVVVATIPILCAFPFFQKYIEKGAVLGGVKE